MPDRYDVLVLGGGAAGCVVAARLAERDARVCLVEAGPDYGGYDEGRWPAELLDAHTLPMTHLWEREDDERDSSRARVIGGCSAHNAAMVVRGEPRDYEWGDGWTYAALEPYLNRAEAILGTQATISDRPAPWHRAGLAAAAGLGVPAGPLRANVRGAVRWNAAFAYLDPRDRVEIRADTLVDRVEPPRVHTDRGVLEADTIVLAAGAYGTPPILLRSGLGEELPVGEGLVDHVGAGTEWAPTEALVRETAAHEAEHGRVCEPYALVTPPDLHLIPWTNPVAGENGYQVTMPVFFLQPRSRGSVSLRSQDPRVPPVIRHGFLADERDAEPLVEGIELARRLVRSEPLARYAAEEVRPGTDDVARYVRENVRGYFHPVGTCALGAVCDGRGRVLEHERLVVADASFVPSIPRANTHLTVLAVAERIAETL